MKSNSKSLAVTAGIVAAVSVSLLAMVAVLNRRDQIVGVNQEIQYDDFAFSVLGVRKAIALGREASPTKAKGVFYILTVKIANHAKRVSYMFKKSSPRLVDVKEREFPLSVAGQQALESMIGAQCSSPIPAGASCVTEVVFDLPEGAEVSKFRISEGGLIGDILDVVFFGKKRIELSSLQ
jgi:uncharacterized protein DUF4352